MREELKKKLREVVKTENSRLLETQMELLSTENLILCLNCFESRENPDLNKLVGLNFDEANKIRWKCR